MDGILNQHGQPDIGPTKSKGTQEKYLQRGVLLRNRAARELGYTPDWAAVANWASQILRPSVSKSSWRQYRAALLFSIEQWADHASEQNPFEMEGAFNLLEAARTTLNEGVAGELVDPKKRRTSSMKQKSLPPDDLKKIEDYAALKRSTEYLGLTYFLRASILTGLRPSEWFNAKLKKSNGKNVKLIVKNGKHSNGRAHGEQRTLSLAHLTEEQRQIVEINHRMLCETSTLSIDAFEDVLAVYRRRLNYISSCLWPKRKLRPTLYSGRHQFAADCKARGCSFIEVAALMGHASDRTATEHYGRKSSGSAGLRPEADPEDMANVRHKMRLVNPDAFVKGST